MWLKKNNKKIKKKMKSRVPLMAHLTTKSILNQPHIHTSIKLVHFIKHSPSTHRSSLRRVSYSSHSQVIPSSPSRLKRIPFPICRKKAFRHHFIPSSIVITTSLDQNSCLLPPSLVPFPPTYPSISTINLRPRHRFCLPNSQSHFPKRNFPQRLLTPSLRLTSVIHPGWVHGPLASASPNLAPAIESTASMELLSLLTFETAPRLEFCSSLSRLLALIFIH